MILLLLFTQVINALVSSNTNLGKKLPKNDATITWKNDDATVKSNLKKGVFCEKISDSALNGYFVNFKNCSDFEIGAIFDEIW